MIEIGKHFTFDSNFFCPMKFIWVPPGEFVMGSPYSEMFREYKEHQTLQTISEGFWMAQAPTTVEQWGHYMEKVKL